MDTVRTIFFGSGKFALPALQRLVAAEFIDVSLVITAPPRPAGRQRVLRQTPVALGANAADIQVRTPAGLRDPDLLAELRHEAPELIVLADYGRIIPPSVLGLPDHGALNLHPSLLPRHRGASPVPAAILAGDEVTGVTLMRMDEGLDSGPILAQRELSLSGTEVAPELEQRLAEMGADLLISTLPSWLAGTLPARPQSAEGVTLTKPLRRPDGRLDATRGAAALSRQVRAYQPWPGSFLEVNGERLTVWSADVGESESGDVQGRLVPAGDGLALTTTAGRLVLVEVQPSGKRRMTAAEYRRGRRVWPQGD